jgi:hypothetical protein
MPYVLLHDHLPQVAERETRTVTVLGENPWGLPRAQYSLLEMYCDELECDCRRVFLYVVSSSRKGLEVVIAYGWETPEFYARWLKDDDPELVSELMGPVLNLGSPETALAPSILRMVQDLVLQDEAYVGRLRGHYVMFKRHLKAAAESSRRQKGITSRSSGRSHAARPLRGKGRAAPPAADRGR